MTAAINCLRVNQDAAFTRKPMPDLADAETRRETALKRMCERFPVNRGLWPIYLLMSRAHARAIDYIEQAPVIVAAATRGQRRVSRSERAFIQEQFAEMCESGLQLRDVMRAYGLPLPLRLLDACVLTATRATVIRRLALINPSTLAQIIPATRQKQNAWLEALDRWCVSMAHRQGDDSRCLFFEWAATNYRGVTYGESKGASHMVDFVLAHANMFNPRWTLNRARAEEEGWHAGLYRAELVKLTGMPLDTVIDYRPLPLNWEHGGLSFVALQTGRALHAEGAAMGHCVATYWRNVINGESRIYSIIENGSRVATLEVIKRLASYGGRARHYQVGQLVGARNSRATADVSNAVAAFLEEINDHARQA